MRNNNPFENSSHQVPNNPFETSSSNNLFSTQKIDTFSNKDTSFEDEPTKVEKIKENNKQLDLQEIKTLIKPVIKTGNTKLGDSTSNVQKSTFSIIIGIILIIVSMLGVFDDSDDLDDFNTINDSYQLVAEEQKVLNECIKDIQNNQSSFDISKLPKDINWDNVLKEAEIGTIYEGDSYKIVSVYDFSDSIDNENNNFYKLLFILENNTIKGFRVLEKNDDYDIIHTWDIGNVKLDGDDDISYYD